MGQCFYVCDKENRTCFEIGKEIPNGFKSLCQSVNYDECTIEHFITQGKERLDRCEITDILFLYYYIKSIKKDYYRFIYGEEILCDELFNIQYTKLPVYQVGSLYKNCTTHLWKP